MKLRLKLVSVEFDGLYCNLTFQQADRGLPSINEQVIKIQTRSVELQHWIEQRKAASTVVEFTGEIV